MGSDDLYKVKSGKLKLKGEKKKHKKEKKKKRDKQEADDARKAKKAEMSDRAKHGGWWAATELKHVTGPVAIQLKGSFVKSVDDGTFTIGAPHGDGEGPEAEEILLAIKINDTKVAFKSGYGKYLSVSKEGKVTGTAEAVGPMEQWETVFQDGKLALLGANSRFMTLNESSETVECSMQRAGEDEMIKIRSNAEREEDKAPEIHEDDQGNVGQIELNYVKKFQCFQGGSLFGVDKKIKLCNDDRRQLLEAKNDGSMHETMLDRRVKMKADRYCK